MSRKQSFILLGKLCIAVLLVSFSFESFELYGDASVFEVMASGLSFSSVPAFLLALILLAVYILSLLSLTRLDTSSGSNRHIPVLVLWILSGLLCLVTSVNTEGSWWFTLILAILSCVFPFLASSEEGEDSRLFSPGQVRTISRLVLLLVLLAFFQPVACDSSGYEVIGNTLFEFSDASFIGAWLLLGIIAVALINALGHFNKQLDRGSLLPAISLVLCILFCIFFVFYMINSFSFGLYFEELGNGYWNTLTLSILSLALIRKSSGQSADDESGDGEADSCCSPGSEAFEHDDGAADSESGPQGEE